MDRRDVEGTLVIDDVRDSTTRSLVWRAIASEEKSDAAKIEGILDDIVKKSMKKYPPLKLTIVLFGECAYRVISRGGFSLFMAHNANHQAMS